MEQDNERDSRIKLLENIQRMINMVLDRLEKETRENQINNAQARLLASISLRGLRLWHEALKPMVKPESVATELERLEKKTVVGEDDA